MNAMNDESILTSVLRHNIDLMQERAYLRQNLVSLLREYGVTAPLVTENLIIYELEELLGNLRELIQDVAVAQTADEAWGQSERCYDYLETVREKRKGL